MSGFQASDSDNVHEAPAFSSSPSSSSSSLYSAPGHAGPEDGDDRAPKHKVIRSWAVECQFPIHLLSACSAADRTMCSITSRDISSGARQSPVSGTLPSSTISMVYPQGLGLA